MGPFVLFLLQYSLSTSYVSGRQVNVRVFSPLDLEHQISDKYIDGHIPNSLARFGKIPYGSFMIAPVVYLSDDYNQTNKSKGSTALA
jgi:hypothetical protein